MGHYGQDAAASKGHEAQRVQTNKHPVKNNICAHDLSLLQVSRHKHYGTQPFRLSKEMVDGGFNIIRFRPSVWANSSYSHFPTLNTARHYAQAGLPRSKGVSFLL